MLRLLMLLLLAGCDGGGSSSSDSGGDLGGADLAPARLTAGATMGTVTLKNSDITVSGTGTFLVGSISVVHGAGEIELDGRKLPAAVYQRQAFPVQNLALYQTLVVEPDRMWVLWLYCSTVDNSLSAIYYEATDGTRITVEDGLGTCQEIGADTIVPVSFPAFDLPQPPLVDGYQVLGQKVSIDGAQPGWVELARRYSVFVFNTVDCSDCGTPGWLELHSLLWDPEGAQVCFGIFYLRANDPDHVQLAWSLTLPSLIDPAGDIVLPAAWKAP